MVGNDNRAMYIVDSYKRKLRNKNKNKRVTFDLPESNLEDNNDEVTKGNFENECNRITDILVPIVEALKAFTKTKP